MPDIDNVVSGQPILAVWGNEVTDELNAIGTMRAQASRSAFAGLDSGQVIPWQVEDYDEGGLWAIGTPSRFTIPAGGAGLYLIWINASVYGSWSGQVGALQLRLNGAVVATGPTSGLDGYRRVYAPLFTMRLLTVGDYLEASVVHGGGSTAAVLSEGSTMGLCRLSA